MLSSFRLFSLLLSRLVSGIIDRIGDGVLCFNLGYNLCTPSVKGCANTIKRPCIEREKNISDIEILHVDIVSMKSIRSESVNGTDGGLLLRGTVTTAKHNKIMI